jgi:hypothetical protein
MRGRHDEEQINSKEVASTNRYRAALSKRLGSP